jgi:aspartate racemase
MLGFLAPVAGNASGCFSLSGDGERFPCAARISAAQTKRRGTLARLCFLRKVMVKAAGAEVTAIPAVTPHFCVRELIATSPLPVFNIFEPLVQELAARAARRVAVFGTRFVMESALFGEVNEVEIIKSRPHEVDYIHNTYVELARTGEGSAEQHRNLTALAHTLIKRDGVDAIILAGTDLALLFNGTNTDFPYIDCAALHLQAILNELLGETPPNSR